MKTQPSEEAPAQIFGAGYLQNEALHENDRCVPVAIKSFRQTAGLRSHGARLHVV